MPTKQHNYRKRKATQGIQRVEVLVPAEWVGYLKAYARALRDANELGARPPDFDGMRRDDPGQRHDFISPSSSHSSEDQQNNNCVSNQLPKEGLAVARRKKPKPDFSGGLF